MGHHVVQAPVRVNKQSLSIISGDWIQCSDPESSIFEDLETSHPMGECCRISQFEKALSELNGTRIRLISMLGEVHDWRGFAASKLRAAGSSAGRVLVVA